MTRHLYLRVTRRANADIDRAADWWDQNRLLAPDVLRQELDRVHYYLYYSVRGEEVQVLALWPTSRGPGRGI